MDAINIMIIDDDRVSQIYLGELIDSILPKASVCKVDSGEHALKVLKEKSFQYVFSDILMPELSGSSLFLQLKNAVAHMNSCKIIAVSSISDSKKIESIVGEGIDAVLCKPVEIETLQRLFKGEMVLDSQFEIDANVPATCLDIYRIVKLYKNKHDKIASILRMYADNLPGQFQKLHDNLESNNASSLHAMVHSIKNSFSYLGHTPLTHLTKTLEDKLLNGTIDDGVKTDVSTVLAHKDLIINAVNKLINHYEKR